MLCRLYVYVYKQQLSGAQLSEDQFAQNDHHHHEARNDGSVLYDVISSTPYQTQNEQNFCILLMEKEQILATELKEQILEIKTETGNVGN